MLTFRVAERWPNKAMSWANTYTDTNSLESAIELYNTMCCMYIGEDTKPIIALMVEDVVNARWIVMLKTG